jgi:hypothetical protein
MIKVYFAGNPIWAIPKRKLANGDWIMTTVSANPRCSLGEEISIPISDIVDVPDRALLSAATEPPDTEIVMPAEVDGLTDIVKLTEDIKKLASDTAMRFKSSIGNVQEAIGVANNLSKELDKSAAALRGVLGMSTNNPPTETQDAMDLERRSSPYSQSKEQGGAQAMVARIK